MNSETILRREDGTRVKIDSDVYLQHSKAIYRINVLLCKKGKRKFIDVVDGDNWERRELSMEDRKKWDLEQQLKHVTIEEIMSALFELWEKLKPGNP